MKYLSEFFLEVTLLSEELEQWDSEQFHTGVLITTATEKIA